MRDYSQYDDSYLVSKITSHSIKKVWETQKITNDIVAARDKDQLIARADDVQWDDFYVQAMERIAKQCADKVKSDLTVMQKNFSYLNMVQQWLSMN